jgi:maltose alpha-D-glucosyltransferase/alpha-amylase
MIPEGQPAHGQDPLWYKDAIIYALHVKTFADGNSDGIGDFKGLTARLDYLASLGVTCLWLLPFYESPLRDDGYDIAHYERVDPRYGSLDDFKEFLAAAHARGLKVITELVINHTSDQHPWFQAARRAPAGSPKRDFYVWSDTTERYAGARVIFHEVETSNWAWDPIAGAYYWHRFYHHQPDLNFENPLVQRAVLKVMRFWLDLGVDGLRLDAVAHLYECEGTSCDNLPATHAFLKTIRAAIDAHYPDRALLAEANQSAADTRSYFGEGDECHMAFHFPLMPRLFLALAEEDGSPVAEIIRHTQDVPDSCQWALFLRNHDEFTLSAVTGAEREVLLDTYAPDARMRLNHGIRRRLAPLLGNDRRRIELAHALLLSLPGSPVLYYGDEIGMGDNVHLGDRDGLRTPMQWSDDVHGGFARTSVAHLIIPAIDEPPFGYRTINVAAQMRDRESLLAAVRSLIRARQRHPAFGRGTIEFVDCGSAAILAFVRRLEDETMLVVANLSSGAQSALVDLPAVADASPVRLTEVVDVVRDTAFPVAAGSPFQVTLEAHACRWFQILPAGAGANARSRASV